MAILAQWIVRISLFLGILVVQASAQPHPKGSPRGTECTQTIVVGPDSQHVLSLDGCENYQSMCPKKMQHIRNVKIAADYSGPAGPTGPMCNMADGAIKLTIPPRLEGAIKLNFTYGCIGNGQSAQCDAGSQCRRKRESSSEHTQEMTIHIIQLEVVQELHCENCSSGTENETTQDSAIQLRKGEQLKLSCNSNLNASDTSDFIMFFRQLREGNETMKVYCRPHLKGRESTYMDKVAVYRDPYSGGCVLEKHLDSVDHSGIYSCGILVAYGADNNFDEISSKSLEVDVDDCCSIASVDSNQPSVPTWAIETIGALVVVLIIAVVVVIGFIAGGQALKKKNPQNDGDAELALGNPYTPLHGETDPLVPGSSAMQQYTADNHVCIREGRNLDSSQARARTATAAGNNSYSRGSSAAADNRVCNVESSQARARTTAAAGNKAYLKGSSAAADNRVCNVESSQARARTTAAAGNKAYLKATDSEDLPLLSSTKPIDIHATKDGSENDDPVKMEQNQKSSDLTIENALLKGIASEEIGAANMVRESSTPCVGKTPPSTAPLEANL